MRHILLQFDPHHDLETVLKTWYVLEVGTASLAECLSISIDDDDGA